MNRRAFAPQPTAIRNRRRGGVSPTEQRGRGFSLVEVAISIVIISVMYAAVLNTVAAARVTQIATTDQVRGHELANELIAQIVLLPYVDPQDAGEFGPGSVEGAVGRAQFDDVDDYHKYTESPPMFTDGTAMPDLAGWTRAVTVQRVSASSLAAGNVETGAKLITVEVLRGSKTVAIAAALRTNVD